MTTTVRIPVEDPTTTMLTYNRIRLYRDTTPQGAFSTLVTTITLVAAQTLYTYVDAGGDANSVYQHEYYNTVSLAVSPRSESYYTSGATLLRLRLEAAKDAGAGFESNCSALGTTTTLIDAALADSGVDTAFLEASWIYRPNATNGDKVRRVKRDGFTVAASSLGIDRAWSVAPANGELYHMFNFFPPTDRPGAAYSWDRVVREGLKLVWFVDQVDLGAADGVNPRTALAAFPDLNENSIRRIFYRSTASNGVITDVDVSLRGNFWTSRFNAGSFSAESAWPGRTTQNIIVEAVRRDFGLYVDTDVSVAPYEAAKAAIVYVAYRSLNDFQPGKYSGELALSASNWNRERTNLGVSDYISGV